MSQMQDAKVRVGSSCLTRDLVWCECGRGLNLLGKWTYCPNCGRKLDQESYRSAVGEASYYGASLYRNADADRAMLAVEKAGEIARRMHHRQDCPAARLEVDDHQCKCGLHGIVMALKDGGWAPESLTDQSEQTK